MCPLESPSAKTLMEIPSGADEKHSEVMSGVVVTLPTTTPLTVLSSSSDPSSLR